MGTRSNTYFLDPREGTVACLYRQFDGYPDGHGHDLANFLRGKRVVNGYSGEDMDGSAFNGMGDLAVRTIIYLKSENLDPARDSAGNSVSVEPYDGIGNFYLQAANTTDSEEYGYYVYLADEAEIRIRVTNFGKEIFDGTPERLLSHAFSA